MTVRSPPSPNTDPSRAGVNPGNERMTFLKAVIWCSIASAFVAFGNDRCDQALPIFLDSVYDVNLMNITAGFSATHMARCVVPYNTELKWYKVTGNGNKLKATTCHSGTKGDTKLWIFEDGVCNSDLSPFIMHPKYLDGNDDDLIGCSSNPFASSAVWNSEKSKGYYIAVGEVDHQKFQLSIDSIGDPKINDHYASSKHIDIGKDFVETTTKAIIDRSSKNGSCAVTLYEKIWPSPHSEAGLWYTFKGNGTHVSIYSLWTYERPEKAWYWTRVWEWKNDTGKVLDQLSVEGQVISQEPLCIIHTDSFYAENSVLYIVMVDGLVGIRNKDFRMIIAEFPKNCDTENMQQISKEVTMMLTA